MLKTIVSLAIAAILVGCASQPAPQSMAVAASATTPAAPTATGSAAPEGAKPAQPVPAGYKARMRKGETVYCKTIEATGSHFPQEACFTQAELDQQKNSAGRLLNKRTGCRTEGCATR